MHSVKTCLIPGHKENPADHICVFIGCDLNNRWCCTQCLMQQKHSHGIQQSYNVIHFAEFFKYIKSQQNPDHQRFSKLLFITNELIELFQAFKKLIKDNIDRNSMTLNKLNELACNQDHILSFSSEEISNILKQQPPNIFIQHVLDESYQKIKNKKQELDNLLKTQTLANSIRIQDEVKTLNLNSQRINSNFQYKLIKLEAKTNYKIFAAQVFPCQNYVAYGGEDSKLKIYNLFNGNCQCVNLSDSIKSLEIQKQSKQIFVGGMRGYVILLESSSNFKTQKTYKYHDKEINQILIVSDSEIITSSSDETIVRFDFYRNQVNTTIKFNSNWFNSEGNFARCIDFNPEKLIIASGTNQGAIQLWDSIDGNELLVQKLYENQNVRSINFTNNYTKLLTLESEGLSIFQSKPKNVEIKIWAINFNQRRLDQLQKFKDQQTICHVQYYKDEEYLVFILETSIKIFQSNMTLVHQIDHQLDDLYPYQSKQPDSMATLTVKGKYSLHLFDFRQ